MRGIPACHVRALWMLGKHDRSLHDRSLLWGEDHRGCPRRRRRRRLTRPGRRMSRSPTRATGASVALANACESTERDQRIDCVVRV
ncbi:hypothetical protein Ctob_015050 [Chrysochromulina tobinii]|uniref:Uncharacterized protein n=1 Tax=Chrysochromulina tobinii TaxID=1460289 RepID=A0A0M0LQY3_9EUKA|nr:hypothetical protein Ctob_015050 [Chrysochromulina tobinii]|eukprot:KOO53153.1 hypothetical protein Ctob_015050 [Chrysochromulina sp. CCMP291]